MASAKDRDVGEADTSTIVKDVLSELFSYDKYSEITAEYMIKSTYCDLALKLDGKLRMLVEVKAVGIELKEPQSKQARFSTPIGTSDSSISSNWVEIKAVQNKAGPK